MGPDSKEGEREQERARLPTEKSSVCSFSSSLEGQDFALWHECGDSHGFPSGDWLFSWCQAVLSQGSLISDLVMHERAKKSMTQLCSPGAYKLQGGRAGLPLSLKRSWKLGERALILRESQPCAWLYQTLPPNIIPFDPPSKPLYIVTTHFTDEENEAQNGCDLFKVSQPVYGRPRTGFYITWL